MWDKLIDTILQFIDDVWPVVVIPHYDQGVRLFLGKPDKKVMMPGLRRKLPFLEKILTHMVKPKTMNLSEQQVTTKDGVSVMVAAVIKYEVLDVRKVILEVNDATDALSDMVQGIVREKIMINTWEECNTPQFTGKISSAAKAEAKKWGLTILEITLTSLAVRSNVVLIANNLGNGIKAA